ncbi:MAG: hypothetical protein ACOX52_09430 [Verrucomicrobiota bacterium]
MKFERSRRARAEIDSDTDSDPDPDSTFLNLRIDPPAPRFLHPFRLIDRAGTSMMVANFHRCLAIVSSMHSRLGP